MINRPPIQAIHRIDADGNPREIIVGRGGVTRIIEVEENGECAFINWVEVWGGEALVARFPQNKLEAIQY